MSSSTVSGGSLGETVTAAHRWPWSWTYSGLEIVFTIRGNNERIWVRDCRLYHNSLVAKQHNASLTHQVAFKFPGRVVMAIFWLSWFSGIVCSYKIPKNELTPSLIYLRNAHDSTNTQAAAADIWSVKPNCYVIFGIKQTPSWACANAVQRCWLQGTKQTNKIRTKFAKKETSIGNKVIVLTRRILILQPKMETFLLFVLMEDEGAVTQVAQLRQTMSGSVWWINAEQYVLCYLRKTRNRRPSGRPFQFLFHRTPKQSTFYFVYKEKEKQINLLVCCSLHAIWLAEQPVW